MTGVYTNIVTELAKRINAGYTSLGLKSLQILSKPERLQPDMTPYVQILPDTTFIQEDYGRAIQNRQKTGDISVVVMFEVPIKCRDGESLITGTKINDNVGFISATGTVYFIEKLLDYINTSLTSTLDPQLADSSLSMAINVTNIIKHETTISGEINITARTNGFVINNRLGV